MDGYYYLITGAALGASGGLAAGPLTALVISQTVRFGFREGAKVAFAPVLTDGPLLLIGALTVQTIGAFEPVMAALSLVGALFLTWLALDCAHSQPPSMKPVDTIAPNSTFKAILTNLLNPHPYLFWFFAGGPLVAEAASVTMYAVAAFLCGFFGLLVGSKLAIAILTARLDGFFAGRGYLWTMRILGFSIAICAGLFLAETLRYLVTIFQTV